MNSPEPVSESISKVSDKSFKHGRSAFINHGCKCDICRQANNEYHARYQKADPLNRRKNNEYNRRAYKRRQLAIDWIMEHRPDVWEQIHEEAKRG